MNDTDRQIAQVLWPDEPPRRQVKCRHCGQRNRVSVPVAVFDPDRCECGACHRPLFLGRDEPLTAMASRAYEHGLDRKSLDALKALPGFPTLVKWGLKQLGERSFRYLVMASQVRCGPDQFPELVELLDVAGRRLDLPWRPTVFLGESPFVNAGTMGIDDPMIVVQSALLDQLDDAEVITVLGHELGHLHAEHIVYRTLASLLLVGGAALGGFSRLITLPLQLALLKWARCAELTCDRAGLLASRDLGASLRLLMKFAGGHRPGTVKRTRIELAPFVRQARELSDMEEATVLDSLVASLITMRQTHPFVAWRLLELLRWVEAGSYLDILAGEYPREARASDE